MKLITISKIGYNAPSGANWCYGIWKVDLIDTKNNYCMSYTVKEAFGGDSRLKEAINKEIRYESEGNTELVEGVHIIETKGVYPSQKITGVRSMQDMESKEFIKELKDFLK